MNAPAQHADRTPWLDGWRGLAILGVMFEHFAGMATGRLGVELFFVLSGLLMSRILFVQRVPIPLFYQRRIARILPVFYLYLLTMVVVGLVMLPSIDWRNVLATAVFMRSYVGDNIWLDPLGFGHIWSLNVEEHAYVLLSIIAVTASRKSESAARWCLTALAALSLVLFAYFRLFPPTGGTPPGLRTECAIFPLMASAAIYLWIRAYNFKLSPRAFCSLMVSALALVVVDHIGIERGGLLIRNLMLPLALATLVNLLHCAPTWVRSALSAKWLTWFGVCSYSLYLWNYPFFHFEADWQLGHTIGGLCSVAVAAASFYWFEQPMRAWLRGERSKNKNGLVAPGAAVATDEAK